MPTPKTYVLLPGQDAYTRAVCVICIQQSQSKQGKKKEEEEATDQKVTMQQSPCPAGSLKSYTVSDFSFWLHVSSFVFCIITQHIWVYSRDLHCHAWVMAQQGCVTLLLTLHLASGCLSMCGRLHLLQQRSYRVMAICINS